MKNLTRKITALALAAGLIAGSAALLASEGHGHPAGKKAESVHPHHSGEHQDCKSDKEMKSHKGNKLHHAQALNSNQRVRVGPRSKIRVINRPEAVREDKERITDRRPGPWPKGGGPRR